MLSDEAEDNSGICLVKCLLGTDLWSRKSSGVRAISKAAQRRACPLSLPCPMVEASWTPGKTAEEPDEALNFRH